MVIGIHGMQMEIKYWLHKVQLAVNTDNASTKGQNITWQTPTADGTILAAYPNADKKAYYRDRAVFDTEAEAYAWVDEKAGIGA